MLEKYFFPNWGKRHNIDDMKAEAKADKNL